jgi:hypothetical protein
VPLPSSRASALCWGLKESFRAYFQRLPDHAYEMGDGATRDAGGRFVYPVRTDAGSVLDDPKGQRVLAFAGSALLTAHFGALSVAIAGPEVRVDSNGRGDLSAAVDEEAGRPVRMVIAHLYAESSGEGAEGPWVRFSATLAPEGQYLFMGNYFAGDPLDPVVIRFEKPSALDGSSD